jgi:hypothetical protein
MKFPGAPARYGHVDYPPWSDGCVAISECYPAPAQTACGPTCSPMRAGTGRNQDLSAGIRMLLQDVLGPLQALPAEVLASASLAAEGVPVTREPKARPLDGGTADRERHQHTTGVATRVALAPAQLGWPGLGSNSSWRVLALRKGAVVGSAKAFSRRGPLRWTETDRSSGDADLKGEPSQNWLRNGRAAYTWPPWP